MPGHVAVHRPGTWQPVAVQAAPVNPRDVSFEQDPPAYRVHFWTAGQAPRPGGVRWTSDEWRLTDAHDVTEVLDFAAARATGRRVELLVEMRDPSLGLVRLLGIDPTEVRLRCGELRDADELAALFLRARSAAVASIPPPVHSDEEVRSWFQRVVLVELEVWVAELGGRLVGLLVLDGNVVEQLYVEPTLTRWRIGTQLLGLAKDLRPRGLELWTFEANEAARRFYERHGFVALERSSDHSEEGVPDVRYRWPGDAGAS